MNTDFGSGRGRITVLYFVKSIQNKSACWWHRPVRKNHILRRQEGKVVTRGGKTATDVK
jgi:hypothetical protein